jgi:SAM-dependent methyltransferase
MWTLIRYFFYLGWNWNWPLAWFVCKHEWRGEKKYGISTTGYDELKGLEKKGIDIQHATIYMPANYYILEHFLEKAALFNTNGRFLDLGCGKGRVLAVAAHYGYKKITGIDFSADFIKAAKDLIVKKSAEFPNTNFEALHQDAFYYDIPEDVETVFLFNPFDDVLMSGIVENLLNSMDEQPRTLYIIYINPVHRLLFEDAGFEPVYEHKKLQYLEGVILRKKPD